MNPANLPIDSNSIYIGVLEKVGVQPEVERIGKYKSAGDLISRKDMSEANREMLTALLDDIYHNWLEEIAQLNGIFFTQFYFQS